MGRNNKKKLVLASLVALVFLLLGNRVTAVSAKSYQKAITKVPGRSTYPVYQRVSKKGPKGKFTSTKHFKYAQIQSKQVLVTKKGTFWKIIVDGRPVGWVSQDYFTRNKISVAKRVSLVQNADFTFDTREAINYVADETGTAVDISKVSVSNPTINSGTPGRTIVTYRYGDAEASVPVTVRSNAKEGIVRAKKGPFLGPVAVPTWKGSSKSTSRNWNAKHNFTFETKPNTFYANGLTLRTELFQPRFVSLDYHQAADKMGQVGIVPEGIAVHGSNFTVAVFNSSKDQKGHLVSYDLKQIGKYQAQNLPGLKWKTFEKYAAHIKVSTYIKLGHGQAIGSSAKYLYVIANNNTAKNSIKSEEIMQIRKSDLKINQIWSFKIWNGTAKKHTGRYIHNATFVGNKTMYCLFHNGRKHRYEYWKVTRSGDTWTPVEIGATDSDFISNSSPVQGFTYDREHGQFYIGFNDYIFKVAKNGAHRETHRLNVKREIEGLSVSGNKLYVEFAQRGELTSGRTN
ncbi:GW dipeptide domain-containing protein [Lactobacillus xylocopicola]|uniref:GW domain-containing protein n=1 Tax=Lactobacillus xylocopicola TaxID=2976676 RepID=A0ABM8BG79_9LACO|nr:GW dipeptide domain-containing protein [Lactobacillus xylocopicola]BDR60263.1 hypothetical protein KIM322_05240 [Lactobacillus xylocopicola]